MELTRKSSFVIWKYLVLGEEMEYKKLSHSIYHCNYHIVIVTKYRRKILNLGVMWYLKVKIQEIRKYYPELEWIEINWEKDHVHILVSIPPKMRVSDVIRTLKCNTAKSLKSKFDYLNKVYWWTDSLWSNWYFVSTTWVSDETVRKYIEHQGQEDFGQLKIDL